MPLDPDGSFSEYFDNDPAFLEALQHAVLSGDQPVPVVTQSLKRPREEQSIPAEQAGPYAPSKFGEFAPYMQAKRQKLQIQNNHLDLHSSIFKGVAIYVNGSTQPSLQDLKQLVMEHGGQFHAYLDKHALVTHIITCSLTPAKLVEFKRMKVVRPEWLVDSVTAGRLLYWREFIFQPDKKAEQTQGAQTGQTSLVLKEPPRYAQDESNPNAQRAMATRGFREAHTSAAPGFIQSYYKNSRLHLLSAWKLELRTVVEKALAKAGELTEDSSAMPRSPSKKGKGERVIMHCDFDAFFVSAGLVDRPDLRGFPVVVCHSQGNQGGASSTSEIASASYEARAKGVKNGMSLQQARQLCPTVRTIPYDFERYKGYSLKFYEILMRHADDFQAVSIDEALLDVTSRVSRTVPNSAKILAEDIRTQVREATSCEISIGISHNILLARLATRKAKPAGSYHLVAAEAPAFVAPMDIADLHGFGRAIKDRAQEKLGTTKLGDLATRSKATLIDALGRANGEKVYNAIRGVDETQLESEKQRKSVSCEINYGIRFKTNFEAETFVHDMANTVSERLDAAFVRGKSLTLKIMLRDPSAPVEPSKFLGHGPCTTTNRQVSLPGPTRDPKVIGDHAWNILKLMNFKPTELRGIGIHIQKLEKASAKDCAQGRLLFQSVEKGKEKEKDVAVQDNAFTGEDEIQVVRQVPKRVNAVAGSSKAPFVGFKAAAAGPSKIHNHHELPTMSQVDPSFLDALPDDLRRELEGDIKRRSVTPALARASEPPWPKKKIIVKGTHNRRLLDQVEAAPPSESPTKPKHVIVKERQGKGPIWTEDEMNRLGLDAEVFRCLPPDAQFEALTGARFLANGGVVDMNKKRVINKPAVHPLGNVYRRPFPKAEWPPEAEITKPPPESRRVTSQAEIQDMMQSWVERQRRWAPNEVDVCVFEAFLVGSVGCSDGGMYKAVSIIKWWVRLLRRHHGEWEDIDLYDEEDEGGDEGGAGTRSREENAGRGWWVAFRRVKEGMDVVARKRFGGALSIR